MFAGHSMMVPLLGVHAGVHECANATDIRVSSAFLLFTTGWHKSAWSGARYSLPFGYECSPKRVGIGALAPLILF